MLPLLLLVLLILLMVLVLVLILVHVLLPFSVIYFFIICVGCGHTRVCMYKSELVLSATMWVLGTELSKWSGLVASAFTHWANSLTTYFFFKTGSHHVVQAGFKLTIAAHADLELVILFLPQLPRCWVYRLCPHTLLFTLKRKITTLLGIGYWSVSIVFLLLIGILLYRKPSSSIYLFIYEFLPYYLFQCSDSVWFGQYRSVKLRSAVVSFWYIFLSFQGFPTFSPQITSVTFWCRLVLCSLSWPWDQSFF